MNSPTLFGWRFFATLAIVLILVALFARPVNDSLTHAAIQVTGVSNIANQIKNSNHINR